MRLSPMSPFQRMVFRSCSVMFVSLFATCFFFLHGERSFSRGYARASADRTEEIEGLRAQLALANDALAKNGKLMPSNVVPRDIPDIDAYGLALTIVAIDDLPDREDERDPDGLRLRYFKTTVRMKDGRPMTFVNNVSASSWELMAIDFMHGRFRRAREAEERARVAGN